MHKAELETLSRTYLCEEQIAQSVFAKRDWDVRRDNDIHHYNWLGEPVYQSSSTSPSDSLAVIQGQPKLHKAKDSLRIQTIMYRALEFVDPIVMILEEKDQQILQLRGTDLARASCGKVCKYYTPHGKWTTDGQDAAEIITDHGSLSIYKRSNLAVGNNLVDHDLIQSPQEWLNSWYAALSAAEATTNLPRKMSWKPRRTSLQQVQVQPEPNNATQTQPPPPTPPEQVATQPPQCNGTTRARKRRRKYTAAVKHETHEYFSFPAPDFSAGAVHEPRKKARCRKFIKRMWTTIKSAFRPSTPA